MNHVKRIVQAEEVYRRGYTGKGVRIAVLDTGVYAHRDIVKRVVFFKNYMGKRQTYHDDNGHGTHVAGILCGDGSISHGVVRGMTPGAELVVFKVPVSSSFDYLCSFYSCTPTPRRPSMAHTRFLTCRVGVNADLQL